MNAPARSRATTFAPIATALSAFFLAIATVVCVPQTAEARGIRRAAALQEKRDRAMHWYGNERAAENAARQQDPPLPIVCFLRRAAEAADTRYTANIWRNEEVAIGSTDSYAAYRVDLITKAGRDMATKYGIKNDGALLWFDQHGNLVWKKDGDLRVEDVTSVVLQWDGILERVQRDVTQVVERARTLAEGDQPGAAIDALKPILDYAGPLGDEIRRAMSDIEAAGNRLLDGVDRIRQSDTARKRLLTTIASQYRTSSVEARARQMMLTPAEQPAPPAQAATTDAPSAGTPAPIDVVMKAVAAAREGSPPAGDGQATAQQPQTPIAPGARHLPPGVDPEDFDALVGAATERYRSAKDLYTEAAKTRDNAALRRAFAMLTEASDAAEVALEKLPHSKPVQQLLEGISLLRYACFKLQTP